MQHIFYFFGLIAILYEFQVLYGTQKYLKFKQYLKDTKADDYTSIQQGFLVLQICYVLWALVGIMSSQWLLFLLYFAISLLPKFGKSWAIKVDSIASILLIGFMLINKYHLHLDLKPIIKSIIMSWF